MRLPFPSFVVRLVLACGFACFAAVEVSSAQQSKQPVASEASGPNVGAAPRETPGQRLDRLRTGKTPELPPQLTAQVEAAKDPTRPAAPNNPVPTDPATNKALLATDPGDAPMPGLKRLSPDAKVWIDPVQKKVVLEGEIVLRMGPLELLACLKQTKEHEAIIACETQAYVVHAALLAIGATPGNPARFQPEFTPARGTEIAITIEWKDKDGKKQSADAREWLKNAKTGKQLSYPWVFGGSGFWKDPMTGKNFYQAEDGDFICVSNFPTAMLDLPVESPQANAALMFEAFTERIPDEKTRVTLILTPKLAKAEGKPGDAKPAGKAKPATSDTGKVTAPQANAPLAAAVSSTATPSAAAPAAATATVEATAAPGPSPAATATAPMPRPVTAQQPARGPLRRIFRRP